MKRKMLIQKNMTSHHPKIAFFGTPDVSSLTLERLVSAGYTPSVVVTAPDKPVGRHFAITPTPTKLLAQTLGIPILAPEKLDDDFMKEFGKYECDISIVVAYGKIMSEELISTPSFGTYNIHYSLLPRWRGATPVESAILSDDKVTGVSIQKMEFKLDTGDVIATKETPIGEHENVHELRERLIHIGSDLLVEILPKIFANKVTFTKQDETLATHSKKTKKEDADITNVTNERKKWLMYRAYYGWPRIYFMKDGKRHIVTSARYENSTFIIERVIPEGKKETNYI